MIEVKNLSKKYSYGILKKNYVVAVDDISFHINTGETLGIVGESGSGKTTVGRCLLRFNEPDSGNVVFNGIDVLKLNKRELTKIRPMMQMIFQDTDSSLNPRMKIKDCLAEPFKLQGYSKQEIKNSVSEFVDLVGLSPEHLNRYPHELSGGQNQRVALARALALKPEFLVADEITASLDVSVQAQILELVQRLKKLYSLTILFISHDLAVVQRVCDRVAVMKSGEIVEMGDVDEILDNPKHPYTKLLVSEDLDICFEKNKCNQVVR
ncbi:MAG: ATP-binding cassette domain-containing protein [Methanohalobium sp.]|uniref:ATP-binding cassette domain-containing protein n=1 Tax=Methanohalobium sp. TaxID=2837493 RepID=UPI003978CB9A